MESNRVVGPMKNPPHPGRILKSLYLEPLELPVTEAAKGLGITRKTLSQLINARSGITPDMALKLSEAFNTSPHLWLNLQQNNDLRQAEKKEKTHTVKHFWTGETGLQPA